MSKVENTNHDQHPLTSVDPLSISLHGLHLIEASAGTGKTYTLTTLYLRLLLEQQLKPEQILVVTFTEAATESLRERIRQRIVQTVEQLEEYQLKLDQLKAASQQISKTSVGYALRTFQTKSFENITDPAIAHNILENALAQLDQAAIYTIHGFCQRMLQDYAFISGVSSTATLITNESVLRDTAIYDVWRRRLKDASLEDAKWVQSQWSEPKKLLDALKPILAQDDLQFLPLLDEQQVTAYQNQVQAKLTQLRNQWLQERETLTNLLETNNALNRRYYNTKAIPKIIAEMDALAASKTTPKALSDHCQRLSSKVIQTKCRANTTPPKHPLFELCAELDQALPDLEKQRYSLWFQEAYIETHNALAQAKGNQELLGFDDLLRYLDQALMGTDANATVLATAISNRFPVALIDEFQDTDAKQYRIFKRIYANCLDIPKHGLFLIGDPKQAIYSFRGADVFTYMQAKDDATQDHQHSLDINWRSSPKLITAINTLFNNTPEPFIYVKHIPFQPVKAASKTNEPLIIDGLELAGLQFWHIPLTQTNAHKNQKGTIKTSEAATEAACACAEHIATLLQKADAGQATLGDRPLQPRDIAVLVRTHREGIQIQQALRVCNVSSVSLSQDLVFNTEQAEELAILLDAVNNSNVEGQLRTALAHVLLGWTAEQIDALNYNEILWEQVLSRFQSYRQQWLERGFMVAFQNILHQEQIPKRLLQRPDGQRWLTNLLQLSELLQANAYQHADPEGLLRWFNAQRTTTDMESNATEQQLRLESDESLVKIVTMHKSKGLEYPVVFIPFPWNKGKQNTDKTPLFHTEDKFELCLDLGSTAQAAHLNLQRKEDVAERMRLFYVAVTRAAHYCVICWGKISSAEDAALALLLHPNLEDSTVLTSNLKALNTDAVRADMEALAAKAPDCIAVTELPTPAGIRWSGMKTGKSHLQAATFSGYIHANWSISSYSGLVRKEESWQPDHDKPVSIQTSEVLLEPATETSIDSKIDSATDADSITEFDPILEFPAGAAVGQYLHSLLEQLDFPKAYDDTLHTNVQNMLGHFGNLGTKPPPDGFEDWGAVTELLLTNCLDTPLEPVNQLAANVTNIIPNIPNLDSPLDGVGLRLRDLTWNNRINELEFHYPLTKLTPKTLQTALAPFPKYNSIATNLEFKPCQGLMHGFIDLVFRHKNRYYIADYKSNRLGLNLQDYDQAGMLQAMQEHRYDLQYLVYSVALHHFLQQRLPNYDYNEHFGGVYYLFLRGMRPEFGTQYGVYFEYPPYQVINALSTLFC